MGFGTSTLHAQDLVTSDFTGVEPSSHTPWTGASYVAPHIRYDGWILGPGATPEPGVDDVFAVNVNAPSSGSDLAQAVADGEYVGFTIEGISGPIDLNGNEIEFTIRRREWYSPKSVSLFTSVDGFTVGAELLTTAAVGNGDQQDQVVLFTFPNFGYDGLNGPVEFRLVMHDATYANHSFEVGAFSLTDPNPGSQGDLMIADFAGLEPSMQAPWLPTLFLDPGLDYGGVDLGPGATPEPGVDDAFAFNLNAGPTETGLAEAIAKDHYLSFTLAPTGTVFDLGGHELRFTMVRQEWTSPRAFSLLTSVEGFTESAALLTSEPVGNSDYDGHEYRFIFPLSGYDDLDAPVELRIYAHDAQYANKATLLTDMRLVDVGPLGSMDLTATEGGRTWTDPYGDLFRIGAPVTLHAEPDLGYRFVGWEGDLGGRGNPRTIPVTGNLSIVARFEPLEFPRMRLGTNLEAVVDWTEQWVWVDQMRFAREWMTREVGTTDWVSDMEAEIPLDAQGWPTELPFTASDGRDHFVHTMVPVFVPGTHTVLVDGSGEIGFAGAHVAPSIQLTGGTTTLQVPVAVDNEDWLFIRVYSSSAAEPVRNIRVVMPGFESTYDTEPFHPLFLDRLAPFQVLRMMDFGQTNHSPLETWADRREPDAYTQAGDYGIALEWMADLANESGRDAWICIPHRADDGYVREAARLLRDRLDPSLKLHVEYSNETWNGLFDQTFYVQDQGMALQLSSDRWLAGQMYVVQRSAQVWRIFEEEFVDDSRLVKVIATQSANPLVTRQRLDALNDVRLNPYAVMPDALAIAPYFGTTFTPDDLPPIAAAYPTVADMLEVQAVRDIEDLQLDVREQRALADEQGLTLLCYEAGQHFVGMNGAENDPMLISLIEQANRDERMVGLYRDYLDVLATERVDDFNHFIYAGAWGKWGTWGALEYQDQDLAEAPKYRALRDWKPLRLTASQDTLSVSFGSAVDFELDGGVLHGGREYQLLAGSSGRFPGTLLPNGQSLPLNTDSFTGTVRAGGPAFSDFVGTLDADGKATAKLTLGPINPALLGSTMHFAAVLSEPWGYPSNPVALNLVP
ncbi:MAG: InlB B-repeat-containing protein [Planctomycetota bacterium]